MNMKKNLLIVPLIIFLLTFLNGCVGYEPIFSSNLEFKIKDHSIKGNKKIGNRIYSKLYNLSKTNNQHLKVKEIIIYINSTINKKPTSKNVSGKILEYKITINSDIKIIDYLTDDELINENYNLSLSYKAQDEYSKTLASENKSVEDLSDGIFQDLLIKLSQAW